VPTGAFAHVRQTALGSAFETDVPHRTCLYPNPLGTVEAKMATLSSHARRKILGENARKLYRL
jgi:uncharacterized protein